MRQLEVLSENAELQKDSIACSSLNGIDRQLAYSEFLQPQLVYPFGCTTLEAADLKRLFHLVLGIILHLLGLNKNFPLLIVHAGLASLGLGIDDLPTMQGIAQLQLLLDHLNKRDRTSVLI